MNDAFLEGVEVCKKMGRAFCHLVNGEERMRLLAQERQGAMLRISG
jgi:hypothetical protein